MRHDAVVMDDSSSKTDCSGCRELKGRIAELERQVQQLSAALEQAVRSGKRQAAPFRKPKKPGPAKKPGRKSGDEHGEHQRRAAPQQIDEVHEAPLPECCTRCRGRRIAETHVAQQYQTEIPRRPITRQFNIHCGQCLGCGARLQGRHALQTSDALGAAASQLGPDAHAAISLANKTLGLSHGKVQLLFREFFGVEIGRATSCRSMLRTAHRCHRLYDKIRHGVRGSPIVRPDETGWRVGGENAWLHVFVGNAATCYVIDPTRSRKPAEELLGRDWSGKLVHDGWSVYDSFTSALHQQCTAHLVRRCQEILQTAVRGAVRFPRAVLDLVEQGFAVRRRRRAGEINEEEQTFAGLALWQSLEQLAQGRFTYEPNRTLAQHLLRHASSWFLYLIFPELEAANYQAEQALRPAVVNRKVWGGNRTQRGAEAQSILMSVLRTLWQNGQAALSFLSQTLCNQQPELLLDGR